MGMSSGGNKGGVSSEINVTPLIDVLLVLLIIFLVVMPIMMKMESLDVPPQLEDNQIPEDDATMITIKVLASGDMIFDDNGKETPIVAADLVKTIEPKVANMKADKKVVFVDFEPKVPWATVIQTMDTIRSLSTDKNHDEVKVALKIPKEETAAP